MLPNNIDFREIDKADEKLRKGKLLTEEELTLLYLYYEQAHDGLLMLNNRMYDLIFKDIAKYYDILKGRMEYY